MVAEYGGKMRGVPAQNRRMVAVRFGSVRWGTNRSRKMGRILIADEPGNEIVLLLASLPGEMVIKKPGKAPEGFPLRLDVCDNTRSPSLIALAYQLRRLS